jgi:hypothetical protein
VKDKTIFYFINKSDLPFYICNVSFPVLFGVRGKCDDLQLEILSVQKLQRNSSNKTMEYETIDWECNNNNSDLEYY